MFNEEDQILDKLKKLQPSQFDEVVFRLRIEREHIIDSGTQTQKAVELIRLINQRQDGIESLNNVLNTVIRGELMKQNIVIVPILMIAMIGVIGFLWNLNNNNQCVTPPCISAPNPTINTGGSSSSPIKTPEPTLNTESPSSSPKYVSCKEYYDRTGEYCGTRQGDDCTSCPAPTR